MSYKHAPCIFIISVIASSLLATTAALSNGPMGSGSPGGRSSGAMPGWGSSGAPSNTIRSQPGSYYGNTPNQQNKGAGMNCGGSDVCLAPNAPSPTPYPNYNNNAPAAPSIFFAPFFGPATHF